MLKVLHLEMAHKILTFMDALIGLQTRSTVTGSTSASIFSLALSLLHKEYLMRSPGFGLTTQKTVSGLTSSQFLKHRFLVSVYQPQRLTATYKKWSGSMQVGNFVLSVSEPRKTNITYWGTLNHSIMSGSNSLIRRPPLFCYPFAFTIMHKNRRGENKQTNKQTNKQQKKEGLVSFVM